MPCDSGYLRPSEREKEQRRAARLYLYVWGKIGGESPPPWATESANDAYGKNRGAQDPTVMLCDLLRRLSAEQRDAIVYDARDRSARDLANWWEDHLVADAAREENERKLKEAEVRRGALAKLTEEEKRVLGLGP